MSFEQDTGTISQEETTVKTVNIAVLTTQAFQMKTEAINMMHRGNLTLDFIFDELTKDPDLSKFIPSEIIDNLIVYDSKFEIYKRD